MKKGFNVMDGLIILTIMGVIFGVILPKTLKAIEKAKERECSFNIRALNKAIEICFSTTRDAQSCDAIDEVAIYLDEVPTCPFGIVYFLPVALEPSGVISIRTSSHFASWPPKKAHHQ